MNTPVKRLRYKIFFLDATHFKFDTSMPCLYNEKFFLP